MFDPLVTVWGIRLFLRCFPGSVVFGDANWTTFLNPSSPRGPRFGGQRRRFPGAVLLAPAQ